MGWSFRERAVAAPSAGDGQVTTPMDVATFTSRDRCLGCLSTALETLSTGRFDEEPLRGFIAADPWGEDPLPYLDGLSWEYVRCRDCALTFQRKVLSPEWAEVKFSRWITAQAINDFAAKSSPKERMERGVHFTKHALQLERLGAVKILDFGCGDGEFIEQCRLYGLDAVGVDRSTARQEKNRGTIYPGLEELAHGQFHAVTLFEVLEHLEHPRPTLESLARVLRPGGILVLETPDTTGVTGIKSFHDYQMIHPLDHINGFTPKTLREFAERLGFRQIHPPVSHATADLKRVIKTEAKRVLRYFPDRTQQYFVKN